MPAQNPDLQTQDNDSVRNQKRRDLDQEDSSQAETGGRFRKPADELDKLARALRFTGDQVDGALSGPLTRTAASVENAAQRLRGATTQDVVQTIESFARQRPLAFLGVAALVGFGGGRFFKSSSTQSGSTKSGSTKSGSTKSTPSGRSASNSSS